METVATFTACWFGIQMYFVNPVLMGYELYVYMNIVDRELVSRQKVDICVKAGPNEKFEVE